MDHGIIYHVENKNVFHKSDLFRFHFDKEEVADNLAKKWYNDVRPPLEVAVNLVRLVEEVYK